MLGFLKRLFRMLWDGLKVALCRHRWEDFEAVEIVPGGYKPIFYCPKCEATMRGITVHDPPS